MSLILNPSAYRKLVQEDLDWLLTTPRTLERDHVEAILKWQIQHAEIVIKMARDASKDEPQP